MCAIAGIYDLVGNRSIDRFALQRMTDAMQHRGPDGEGFFTAPGVGFGHRRLAIIDLEGGKQPFEASKNLGTLCFNGEIYNHRELANILDRKGVHLKTKSDTEALSEGIARLGNQFVHELRGMFAFAFWRAADRSLTLVRDRIGEKPVYYAKTDDHFLVFASEAPAIIASGLIDDEFDPEAVADYCLYGYVPDPKSIYRHIRKLPPATILKSKSDGTFFLENYWRPAFEPASTMTYERARQELEGKFDDAVKTQMIADVPLGAFLSGGVDSGGIVAAMTKHSNQVSTTTIGFNSKKQDERQQARLVAEKFQTDHTEHIVTLDAGDLIDRVAKAYGEPFADSSALPTYAVCRAARQSVTVALSGDGGDEIFAGYRRYPMYLAEERMRSILPHFIRKPLFGAMGAIYPKLDFAPRPMRLKTTLQSLGDSHMLAYARTVAASLPDRASSLLSDDLKAALDGYDPRSVIEEAFTQTTTEDPLSAAQHVDYLTWLAGRMLVKVDRASMAHSLEVRPPLLDHKLIEWAGSVPSTLKLRDGEGKFLLKQFLKHRLPEPITTAKKKGFELPIAQWLRDKNGPLTNLSDSSAWKDTGFFDLAIIDQMTTAHLRGASDYSQELWSVIMADAFIRTRPKRPSYAEKSMQTLSSEMPAPSS